MIKELKGRIEALSQLTARSMNLAIEVQAKHNEFQTALKGLYDILEAQEKEETSKSNGASGEELKDVAN